MFVKPPWMFTESAAKIPCYILCELDTYTSKNLIENKSYQITDGGWDKAKQMHSRMLYSPFYIMSCLGRHKAYLRPNIPCVFCLCLKFVGWGLEGFHFNYLCRVSFSEVGEEHHTRLLRMEISILPPSISPRHMR